jgi:hypothetical protein
MESKKLYCNKCKITFNDKLQLEKHNWSEHPSNKFEESWSKLYKSNQFNKLNQSKHFEIITNLNYQDDPYY